MKDFIQRGDMIAVEEPTNALGLSPEQENTASLLDRLLGKAIADRYTDLCRLSAGAFPLNASRPVAAHALRELDSILRHVLAAPMEADAPNEPTDANQIDAARTQLRALGFEDSAIERAAKSLTPRLTHKNQIRKIVARLGLDPQGDIATRWVTLCDSFGRAHERSFHRSLKVDDEFRSRYQQPFDAVIRAIAAALEGRYAALMRRVEELAAMPDRARAVAAFASEIPGALPVQWHFFQRLTTGDWLPHLAKKGLLGEPLYSAEDANSTGRKYGQWPAGSYLHRMAASADDATRGAVIEAVRFVAGSTHPDLRRMGMEILAALPPAEAAPLTQIVTAWVDRETSFGTLIAADRLLKNLAASGHCDAAMLIARPLLQLWDSGNDDVENLFGHHMYEHHLPPIAEALTTACGKAALELLMDLLVQAAEISRRIDYEHFSLRSVADDEMTNFDPYSALISAVRRSAEKLVAGDPKKMRNVIVILTARQAKIFTRLALHVLAQNPSAAADLVEDHLLNPELIEATWGQEEYAALARAWFPSLSQEQQRKILHVVDALPDKYREAWRTRFTQHHQRAPTADDERVYAAATIRDAVWKWRSVLPRDRQQAINDTVAELGGPDVWQRQRFPEEESALTATDFSSRPVTEIASFLRTWVPQAEAKRQTVTALAQELRNAVGNDPKAYAGGADHFAGLKAIYVRCVLEGLKNAARNERDFDWAKVLKLIEFVYGQHDQTIDAATLIEGDDKEWSWASKAANEVLAAGLRRGAKGIGFEHAEQVNRLVLTALALAPRPSEGENFEESYRRDPYFAAQSTLRGSAIELCMLLMYWLSKDASSAIGNASRRAMENLPEIRNALEDQLADRSPDGRVPRGILGRYLRWLYHFGEDWLRAQVPALLPPDDDELRRAGWRAHLGHDQGPLGPLMAELHGCYAEQIGLLASGAQKANCEISIISVWLTMSWCSICGAVCPTTCLSSSGETHPQSFAGMRSGLSAIRSHGHPPRFRTKSKPVRWRIGSTALTKRYAPQSQVAITLNSGASANGASMVGLTKHGSAISCCGCFGPASRLAMVSLLWNGSGKLPRAMSTTPWRCLRRCYVIRKWISGPT